MGKALQERIQQTEFESPVIEAIFNLFITADFVRSKVDAVCTEFGITGGQYNVLRILRGAGLPGRSRCDIASRLLERAPDVTRLVDRLEARRLVERDKSSQDRRLSITRITEAGLRLLDEMAAPIARLHADIGTRLDRKDAKEISRICEGIYADAG